VNHHQWHSQRGRGHAPILQTICCHHILCSSFKADRPNVPKPFSATAPTRPCWGAYDAPPDSLIGWGGDPSPFNAFGISRGAPQPSGPRALKGVKTALVLASRPNWIEEGQVLENGENGLSDEGAEGGNDPRIFGLEPPLIVPWFIAPNPALTGREPNSQKLIWKGGIAKPPSYTSNGGTHPHTPALLQTATLVYPRHSRPSPEVLVIDQLVLCFCDLRVHCYDVQIGPFDVQFGSKDRSDRTPLPAVLAAGHSLLPLSFMYFFFCRLISKIALADRHQTLPHVQCWLRCITF